VVNAAEPRQWTDVLGGDGALSFCLNDSSMDGGKVWPLSQISRSFLIFSYRKSVSEHSFLSVVYAGERVQLQFCLLG
jgi:hypothetical protein